MGFPDGNAFPDSKGPSAFPAPIEILMRLPCFEALAPLQFRYGHGRIFEVVERQDTRTGCVESSRKQASFVKEVNDRA
jgi:hypothetical protein